LNNGAPVPTLSPVALAATSLADAMKQFDVNGAALGGQSSPGVSSTTSLKLNGVQETKANEVVLAVGAAK
jgi:hypothetical protein